MAAVLGFDIRNNDHGLQRGIFREYIRDLDPFKDRKKPKGMIVEGLWSRHSDACNVCHIYHTMTCSDGDIAQKQILGKAKLLMNIRKIYIRVKQTIYFMR